MQKYIVCSFIGTAVRWVTAQPPEFTGVYDTDRYGELQNFSVCDTSVGDAVFHTDVWGRRAEYTVVVNDITYGNAEYPDEYVFVARWKQWVTE
jgi:hypothetical protein